MHHRITLAGTSVELLPDKALHLPDSRTLIVADVHWGKAAGDPPASLDIVCVDAPLHVGQFAMHHHPATDPSGYVLAGHVHPVVQLRGRGRQKITLPCFAFGEHSGLLPAFGEFTGGAVIDQRNFARTFVIADDSVLSLEPSVAAEAP